MKEFFEILNRRIKIMFCFHSWEITCSHKFESPKMDSYGKKSTNILSKQCTKCKKWETKAF